jgi:hypothetical protein
MHDARRMHRARWPGRRRPSHKNRDTLKYNPRTRLAAARACRFSPRKCPSKMDHMAMSTSALVESHSAWLRQNEPALYHHCPALATDRRPVFMMTALHHLFRGCWASPLAAGRSVAPRRPHTVARWSNEGKRPGRTVWAGWDAWPRRKALRQGASALARRALPKMY